MIDQDEQYQLKSEIVELRNQLQLLREENEDLLAQINYAHNIINDWVGGREWEKEN
jgi:hypothetical protein